MANNKRLFERTDVPLQGRLTWQKRLRTGIVKTNRVDITTVDLSIDGARVSTAKRSRLPVGASVLVSFGDYESPARVRAHLADPMSKNKQLLLLQFDAPSPEFLRHVDHMLDAAKGGNVYKAEYWKNVREDEYGLAEHAKAEQAS